MEELVRDVLFFEDDSLRIAPLRAYLRDVEIIMREIRRSQFQFDELPIDP